MSPARAASGVVRLTQCLKPVARADERVVFMYLFGSTVTGQTGGRGDVDLAVYCDPVGTLSDDASLHERLAVAIGRDDTDVVILNRAPLWLQYRVVGEGVVVFSRDEPRRIAFRERVEKTFLDFRPYHEAYLAAVRERARRGVLSGG